MVIFLINWRIFPAPENLQAFLLKWKTVLRVKNKDGLIGEFLSRVKDPGFFEYVTWELDESSDEYKRHIKSEQFVSFVNVGLWRSKEDFLENIGGNIPKDPWFMEAFEAAPRRRAVVEPEAWRIGSHPLHPDTSPGVLF
jgi:hypothetical protein